MIGEAAGASAKAILVRLIPFQNESLAGYMLRVADRNGYDRASWLLQEVGLKAWQVHHSRGAPKLAALLGVPPDSIASRCYSSGPALVSSVVTFFDQTARRYHLNLDRPRICPQCLAQNGYCKAEWDLRAYVACDIHKVRLIDRCRICSTRISWSREKVCTCPCGALLSEQQPAEADGSIVELMRLIRLAAFPDATVAQPHRHPLMDLELYECLEVVHVLAAYGMSTKNAGKRIAFGSASIDAAYTLAREAAEIMSNWPLGFYSFLDNLRERRSDASKSEKLTVAFGGFYSALTRRLKSDSLHLIRHEFVEYLKRDWGGSYGTQRNKWVRPGPNPNLLSRPEAAKRLGIAPQTVDVLLRNGEIVGEVKSIGPSRTIALIDKGSLHRYRRRHLTIIESQQAAELLGVSRSTYRKLVDQKVICSFHQKNPRLRKAYEVERGAIRRLLRRLDACVEAKPYTPGISFHLALFRLAPFGFDGARVVRAMLTGQIPIVGKNDNKPGLSQYLLSGPEVQLIAERKERERRPLVWIQKPVRTLTADEAMPKYLVGQPPQALIARSDPLPK